MICSEGQTVLIPGYRLLERLGQGGFGEVWKAEAPGGLLKAIKVVYGSLHGSEDDVRVRQELKALERVKTVRHPYILSLERYDVIDGRLVIIMELADRSLWDRFRECQAQGLPGIPRDELLRYLGEAAEALDLMNLEYQLQHLDIKPQNLFLLYNHVKVGDFGLVKDLEGMRAKVTSGVTAAYAPPETFEGLVSRYCDQYNLAIVYQEMLTGRLPFSGTSPQQLMLQHLTGAPDLTPVPPGDRQALARALAKKPEDRYPSCGALIQALRQSNGPLALPAPSTPDPAITRRNRPPFPAAATAPIPSVPPAVAPPPERPEVTGDGVLFPALVIGLGGVGLAVLQQLRRALHKRCGPDPVLPHLRLLQLDTDPEGIRQATQAQPDVALHEQELLPTRLQRPAHYLKPGRERQVLERWLPLAMLSRMPRDQLTTMGCRALGRLAFVSNYATIVSRLRAELEACIDPAALERATQQTGLGLRTNQPRIYLVTSLAGGTGSGMFLDVAYTARHVLKQLGYANPDVVGLFLLPVVAKGSGPALATANALAALTELNHFAAPQTVFSAGYQAQDEAIIDSAPPLSRCFLLPLPEKTNDFARLRELVTPAGEFLYRDLITPLGRTADQCRAGIPVAAPGLSYQTFRAYWFAVPRRLLLERVAKHLCQQLVQSWRTRDRSSLDHVIQTWVAEQFTRRQLSPEQLEARLHAACARVLGQTPDDAMATLLEHWTKGGSADLNRQPGAGAEALAELKRLVSRPQPGDGSAAPASTLEETLQDAARIVGAEVEDQLAEVALSILAEPHFRLTGVEDFVNRHLNALLTEEIRNQKALVEELTQQANTLTAQIAVLVDNLRKRSRLWWGQKAKTVADLVELLRRYGQVRWQGLTRQQMDRLYQSLLGNLHKYLREVGCCRSRIAQFLHSFDDPTAGRRTDVDLGLGQYLLPAGCRTLDESARRILDSLTPEELHDLNQRVQGVIGQAFQAHVHLCTAPANLFKELEEAVYQQVAAFAETQITRAHAAEVYLEQRARDEAALADLAGAFDEAIPELAGASRSSDQEICILAVPPGPEGESFRKLVARALPDASLVAASSTDDIVFYREQPDLLVTELPHMGNAAQEAYQQLLAEQFTPHSRIDISDWLPAKSAAGK